MAAEPAAHSVPAVERAAEASDREPEPASQDQPRPDRAGGRVICLLRRRLGSPAGRGRPSVGGGTAHGLGSRQLRLHHGARRRNRRHLRPPPANGRHALLRGLLPPALHRPPPIPGLRRRSPARHTTRGAAPSSKRRASGWLAQNPTLARARRRPPRTRPPPLLRHPAYEPATAQIPQPSVSSQSEADASWGLPPATPSLPSGVPAAGNPAGAMPAADFRTANAQRSRGPGRLTSPYRMWPRLRLFPLSALRRAPERSQASLQRNRPGVSCPGAGRVREYAMASAAPAAAPLQPAPAHAPLRPPRPGKVSTSGCPTAPKPKPDAPRRRPARQPPPTSRTSPARTTKRSRNRASLGVPPSSVFWAES